MFDTFQTILVATAMFAATNADDLVVLGIFFTRPGCRGRDVVLAQLLGIGALTAMSYAAASLALAIPAGWLPWLGTIPFVIGARWLLRRKDDSPHAEPAKLTLWSMTAITVANGADNLGVYIPTFAVQTAAEKAITCAVFLVLTLVWCAVARWLVSHTKWGPAVSRSLSKAAPAILIAIGLWILAKHPLFRLQPTAEPAK